MQFQCLRCHEPMRGGRAETFISAQLRELGLEQCGRAVRLVRATFEASLLHAPDEVLDPVLTEERLVVEHE